MLATTASRPITTPARPFAAGARAIAPLVAGAVPFGIAIGAAAGGLGVGRLTTGLAAVTMVAGTAQLTAMQLLHKGAAPAVALIAVLVVNARFAVYSAGLAPWFPTTTIRQRLLLAAPLVDQLYLTATTRFAEQPMDERQRRSFYLGAATLFVGAWVAAEATGILLGDRVPEWLGLQTAALLALVGLLATTLTKPGARAAALVAAVVALAGSGLPGHSTVLVATVAGLVAGGARRSS